MDMLPLPPDLLPRIPTTLLVHAPRDDPSDGRAHGFGRFARSLLKFNAVRVDYIIPELCGGLQIGLGQFYP